MVGIREKKTQLKKIFIVIFDLLHSISPLFSA